MIKTISFRYFIRIRPSLVENREWSRHDFHFDDVINAFLTKGSICYFDLKYNNCIIFQEIMTSLINIQPFLSLFVFSTGAGWPDGMWNSIETTKPDQGPRKYNRYDFSIFYIFFTVIFPFFFVNVFIAFVILTFQRKIVKISPTVKMEHFNNNNASQNYFQMNNKI